MNSKEFVGELSRRLGYTNKDAAQLVASVVSILTAELQDGKIASLQGFGTFEVKKKMERVVVNPVTSQRMLVPPKLTLGFRPSQVLKDKLKKNQSNE